MSSAFPSSPSASVFRIDKFVVPAEVVPSFVAQMQRVQQTLHTLPGCLRNHVLTQTGGSGEFNVITLVEWASEQAVAAAQAVVKKKFLDEGFDPVAFVAQNGVRADMGFYGSV
ncbi:antibiotic biosynthesis monooxygenase [Variovorax sp. W2I14]|uniref:antibiotic biosynthesis monooxygenase n=1 Tax=Variovorax sp. W2I14 TaxID=3042290 RepID=UPI003D250CEE